jgi:hypothetical protein
MSVNYHGGQDSPWRRYPTPPARSAPMPAYLHTQQRPPCRTPVALWIVASRLSTLLIPIRGQYGPSSIRVQARVGLFRKVPLMSSSVLPSMIQGKGGSLALGCLGTDHQHL